MRCAYLQVHVYVFYTDETVRTSTDDPLTGKTKAPQAVPIKDHLWVTIIIVISFVVITAAIIVHNYNII